MSAKWMGYFFDETDLKGSELLLALAIADHADAEGRCYPGIEHLSRKIKLQPRQTQILIKRLEKRGFLEVNRKQGRGHFTVFQLKRVMNSAPFIQEKRCINAQEKGAFRQTEKVHFESSPYKDNQTEPKGTSHNDDLANFDFDDKTEEFLAAVRETYGTNILARVDRWVMSVNGAISAGLKPNEYIAALKMLLTSENRKFPVTPDNVLNAALDLRARALNKNATQDTENKFFDRSSFELKSYRHSHFGGEK